MKNKDFDLFEKHTLPELTALLKTLKKTIGDEYRASDDFDDDQIAMRVTISTNEDLTSWSYQTGDNSYSGSCYGDPYWGIATLTRKANSKEIAKELLSDLANQIEFED